MPMSHHAASVAYDWLHGSSCARVQVGYFPGVLPVSTLRVMGVFTAMRIVFVANNAMLSEDVKHAMIRVSAPSQFANKN